MYPAAVDVSQQLPGLWHGLPSMTFAFAPWRSIASMYLLQNNHGN